jgi:pyruvate formate lyase activating enzyme
MNTSWPEGAYYTPLADNRVQCALCPHACVIPDGGRGLCRVRANQSGQLVLPFYGLVTAMAVDPIEKKPLYHFRPGSSILSLGFVGCNLRCPFCQNWHISQNVDAPRRALSPEAAIQAALSQSAPLAPLAPLAYTYSEPLAHIEYLLACMKAARRAGVANVLVSNGCVNEAAADAVLRLTDAANIDLKCYSAATYANVLGGNLDTVLAFIRKAQALSVHLELTTLVVPGLNDSDEEIDRCINFIASLSTDIPWHLSAYHPAYQWDAPPTSARRLIALVERARKTLRRVYAGNLL